MKPGGVGNDPFLDRMERALDVMSRRGQVVASNIGNVDTPGYRTQDIDFKSALERAVQAQAGPGLRMQRTEPAHFISGSSAANAEVAHRVAGLTVRNDGNDVNIDREMLALSETRARFETAASIARLRIRQLLTAIDDGRTS